MPGRVRVITWPRREREEHREAKKERFLRPLSKREITCLKALNDLSNRGFGKVKMRDIARATVRVYPKSYRMAINEVAVLECLATLQKYNYAKGFGHAQPQHQTFLITSDGKELLKKYTAPELDTTPVPAPPREQRIIWVDSAGRWSYRVWDQIKARGR